MGVEIRCGVEVGKDLTIDELRRQGYKAFYIAIGCQGGRMAGIPGEEADGVMTAVDFLRKVGEQEAYPVQGRAVVIGGGDRHPLVALFRECVALRRLVELGQWARRYPQHPLHDRLVGYLLLQKAHRYALAGYDLVLYPCL